MNDRNVPRLAVLLAAYQGTEYIQEQLDTILAQEQVGVTVFVSVDTSRDGTEALVDSLAARDSRIHVLPHGERFGGAAPNFFRLLRDTELSDFDAVAFADQDDIWHPQKLQRACSFLEEGFAAYSGNVTAFWEDGREVLIEKAQPQRRWDHVFQSAGPGCTYVMSARLVSDLKACIVSNWEDVQRVSMHDWLCYTFARANGFSWYIDSRPMMRYRQHGQNQLGANSGLQAVKRRFGEVLDGWWLSQALLIARLSGLGDHVFIRKWSSLSRLAMLRLAVRAPECRRGAADRGFFFAACLTLAVLGHPKP